MNDSQDSFNINKLLLDLCNLPHILSSNKVTFTPLTSTIISDNIFNDNQLFYFYNLDNLTTLMINKELEQISYFFDRQYSRININTHFLQRLIELEKERFNPMEFDVVSFKDIPTHEIYTLLNKLGYIKKTEQSLKLHDSYVPIYSESSYRTYINAVTEQQIVNNIDDTWTIYSNIQQEITLTNKQLFDKLNFIQQLNTNFTLNKEQQSVVNIANISAIKSSLLDPPQYAPVEFVERMTNQIGR